MLTCLFSMFIVTVTLIKCELKMTDTTSVKKRGRPSQGLEKSPAERQRLARSAAHRELLTGDVKNISTSNLISSLPICLSKNLDSYALNICLELQSRITEKLKLQ